MAKTSEIMHPSTKLIMINTSLSVIVPAYNEEKLIGDTIAIINNFLNKNFKSYEIIIVDDCSNDNTSAKVIQSAENNDILVNLIRCDNNLGKGSSVKKGIENATLDYVLFLDADLSTPIDEVLKFDMYMQSGCDVIVGSRAIKDSDIVKSQGFMRRSMGKVFNVFVQAILMRGIKDTQCGFKCFKRTVAKKLFNLQRIGGFCFDAEILFIAKKQKLSIQEVPIKWINREDSRVSVFKDSVMMFVDLFKIRFNDLRGMYEEK